MSPNEWRHKSVEIHKNDETCQQGEKRSPDFSVFRKENQEKGNEENQTALMDGAADSLMEQSKVGMGDRSFREILEKSEKKFKSEKD